MGKFEYNMILMQRPTMRRYAVMTPEQREVIDFTVQNHLKANRVLRLGRWYWRSKKLSPIYDSFWNMTWIKLIELRKSISNNDFLSTMKLVYGIDDKQFVKLEVLNAFACYKWIVEQLTSIREIEEGRLGSEMTEEEKEAGAEDLLEYGHYTALRSICPNLLDQEKYLNLPYVVIFQELACAKKISDINKKHSENVNRKNKRIR